MSHQRRRGIEASIWKTSVVTDKRGNRVTVADADGPYIRRVAAIPQRSARAEVPGQMGINVVRLLVDYELGDEVNLWSRVDFLGQSWDVVTPPSFHHGPRGTRHISLDIRQRP